MAETKVSDPIITFKNVSKTYTLYKDDKARFKALFFKTTNVEYTCNSLRLCVF